VGSSGEDVDWDQGQVCTLANPIPCGEMVQPTARPKNTCAIQAHIDLIWCRSIAHRRTLRIRQ